MNRFFFNMYKPSISNFAYELLHIVVVQYIVQAIVQLYRRILSILSDRAMLYNFAAKFL